MRERQKPKAVWNTDFQSFNKPTVYRVQEQERKGGAGIIMLLALVVGLIIAASVGAI